MKQTVTHELKVCTCTGYGDGDFLYSEDDCLICKGSGYVEQPASSPMEVSKSEHSSSSSEGE